MYTIQTFAIIGTLALTALAVPPPSLKPSGSGDANINFTAGGGILPTLTFGGMMAGDNNEIGLGLSNTVGIGGRVLPTVQIGGGGAFGVNPSVVLGQFSGGVSEGGWLAGLVPTFSIMGSLNNEGYIKTTGGLTVGGGMNGGMVDSLGYGGNFIDPSSLMVSAGGNFVADIHNGAASETSSPASSSSASPTSSAPTTS